MACEGGTVAGSGGAWFGTQGFHPMHPTAAKAHAIPTVAKIRRLRHRGVIAGRAGLPTGTAAACIDTTRVIISGQHGSQARRRAPPARHPRGRALVRGAADPVARAGVDRALARPGRAAARGDLGSRARERRGAAGRAAAERRRDPRRRPRLQRPHLRRRRRRGRRGADAAHRLASRATASSSRAATPATPPARRRARRS